MGAAGAVLFGLYLVVATSCGSEGHVATTATAGPSGSGGGGGSTSVTTNGSGGALTVGSTGSGATAKPRAELVAGGARLQSKSYKMDAQIGHAFWQEPVAGQSQSVDGSAVIK